MKKSIRFLCWLLVGAMFCAVSIGGCGGGHDDNLSGNQEGQDSGGTITSGDTSGGRGDSWEDLAFDMFSGSWELYDIYADVNRSTILDHPELSISRFKFIPHPTARGGNLEITTLDGSPIGQLTLSFWNTEDNVNLTDVVFLSGGTYESTSKSYFYRKNNTDDDYYELEGSLDSNGKLSLPLEYVSFRHYNNYNETLDGDNYVIQTVLHRIPDNTVEDITLVAGDWKIVSASLQMRGDAGIYPMATDSEYDDDPEVKLLPMSGYLFWTDDLYASSPAYNYESLYVPFSWTSRGAVITRPLLDPTAGEYSMITPKIMETPRTDSNGNAITFQRIEGFGLLPWQKISISRYVYTSSGELDAIIQATLERIR